MKKNILLLCIAVAVNCRSYREFVNVENTYHAGNDSLHHSRIVNGSINGKNVMLLFDTGATSSVLYSVDLLGGESILNSKSRTVKVHGAGQSSMVKKFITDSFKIKTFTSKNLPVLVASNNINARCGGFPDNDGILGMDVYFNSEMILLLDYENSKLSWVDSSILQSYLPVDAIFRRNAIYIKAVLEGQRLEFLFDTGAETGVVTTDSIFNGHLVAELQTYISGFEAEHKLNSVLSRYYLTSANLGGLKNEIIISQTPFLTTNIIGIQFISAFNWCLDFKNKKLYAKPIKELTTKKDIQSLNRDLPIVVAINDKLLIGAKNTRLRQYRLGDEIISVKDQAVTPDNICDFQNTLNTAQNWDQYNVVISKSVD